MSLNDNKIPFFNSFIQDSAIEIEEEHNEFRHIVDGQIFEYLRSHGNTGKTRDQICKELQLPRSSVFDALTRLQISKIVEIDFKIKSKSKKGRPSTIYYLKNIPQGKNR